MNPSETADSPRGMHWPLALGITGASGAPYWKRLIEVLLREGITVHVTASENADTVARAELGQGLEEVLDAAQRSAPNTGSLRFFDPRDFNAPMASGSARYRGMIICPCSMGTLSRIAHGVSGDLMTRAADVMLKERRRLLLVTRDTPHNLIHLENMVQVTRAGAVVMPASPGFYYRPQSIDDLVDFVVQRICDHLGMNVELTRRWGSPSGD